MADDTGGPEGGASKPDPKGSPTAPTLADAVDANVNASGAPRTTIVEATWEIRTMELGLIVIGCLVLLVLGVLLAFDATGLHPSASTTSTAVAPVTLSVIKVATTSSTTTSRTGTTTSVTRTPRSVARVAMGTTVATTSSRSDSPNLTYAILALALILLLAGAFYRRPITLDLKGVKAGIGGSVSDRAAQVAAGFAGNKNVQGLSEEEKQATAKLALAKLVAGNVQATPAAPQKRRGFFRRLTTATANTVMRRSEAAPDELLLADSTATQSTPTVNQAIDEAVREVTGHDPPA